MLIKKIEVALAGENTYVIAEQPHRPAIIIDPGMGSFDTICAYVKEYNLTPAAVLLTHGHIDHTWDVATVADHFEIPTYIHRDDRVQLTDPAPWVPAEFAQMLRQFTFEEPHEVIELEPQEKFMAADMEFEVRHVPGHSLGSLVFIVNKTVFSGDTLFHQGVGRSDIRGGNHQQLVHKIRTQLYTLPDEYTVYPGHGPHTTIGQEKRSNMFVQ